MTEKTNDLPEMDVKSVMSVDGYRRLMGHWEGHRGRAVGIDPGANFGITVINNSMVETYYGKLTEAKEPGRRGIYAMIESQRLIRIPDPKTYAKAVVEGAAYAYAKGQVLLEEVRFGFYVGLYQLNIFTRILPPATIRKLAFGGGKIMATDIWPTMNQNAADSIACAIAALRYEEPNE